MMKRYLLAVIFALGLAAFGYTTFAHTELNRAIFVFMAGAVVGGMLVAIPIYILFSRKQKSQDAPPQHDAPDTFVTVRKNRASQSTVADERYTVTNPNQLKKLPAGRR